MANEFYIDAGLIGIDYGDIATVTDNAFYMTAGLIANDYTPAAGVDIQILMAYYRQLNINNCGSGVV